MRNGRSKKRVAGRAQPAQRSSPKKKLSKAGAQRRATTPRKGGSGGAGPKPGLQGRGVRQLFPQVSAAGGYGALLVIVEGAGGAPEVVQSRCELAARVKGRRGTGENRDEGAFKPAPQRVSALRKAWQAFAAIGHEQRIRLLVKLLEGPATYGSLQRVTKLKAGPLYHHINQLRLVGLILPKQRDLYELTRGGRNLMLAAIAVAPLLHDKRRRRQPSGSLEEIRVGR